jgi:hypothetical protein
MNGPELAHATMGTLLARFQHGFMQLLLHVLQKFGAKDADEILISPRDQNASEKSEKK